MGLFEGSHPLTPPVDTTGGDLGDQIVANPWVERLARFGYAAKGVVYLTVGLLAARAAQGQGPLTSKVGALQVILAQPLGQLILAAIVAGLGGYVLWRWVQAIFDPDGKGHSPRGLLERFGFAINGLFYAGLAYAGVEILTGASVNDNEQATVDWTARFLALPYGSWLVGGVGLVVIGIALHELYRVYTGKFCNDLDFGRMPGWCRRVAPGIGRFGLFSRSLVWAIVGIFLCQAAIQLSANKAGGLREALDLLSQSRFGPWVLGLVALGLAGYGLFLIVEARYRQLSEPNHPLPEPKS